MRWIIASSLRFRFLVVAAAAALMVFGAGQLKDARTDAFPEFAPPRVEVQTITLGLSAEETEEFVTVPLEQTLNGVPELDNIRSTTVPQLSSIEMIFKQGTDLIKARQVVQERLDRDRPDAADLGGAAGDEAAAVGGRPGHADRRHLERDVAPSSCRRSPTGRSGRASCACPAS